MIPDHYRGFLAELAAESRGEPVYPVWDDMPQESPPPDPWKQLELFKSAP